MKLFNRINIGVSLLLRLSTLIGVSPFPAFNTPNTYNAEGGFCPLLPRDKLICNKLCAKTPDLCPSLVDPTASCPSGLQRCADGDCYSDCSGVVNPCLCGFEPTDLVQEYVACATYDGTVNVDNFDPGIKESQIMLSCALTFNIAPKNTTVDTLPLYAPVWNNNDTDSVMFLVCPDFQGPSFSYSSHMFISFVSVLGAVICLNILWYFSKKALEKDKNSNRQIFSISSNDVASNSTKETPITFVGYKTNLIGSALFVFTQLVSIGWFVLLAIIVADYYGAVTGVAYGVFLTSNISMAVFIVVWHLSTIWLVVVTGLKDKIRNHYRLECNLTKAKYVQVEEVKESVIMTQSKNKLVLRMRALDAKFKKMLRFDTNISTVKVMHDNVNLLSNSKKFLEYHCARFVLNNDGVFNNTNIDLGNTHSELLKQKEGLTTEQSTQRFNQIGENFVRVDVPSYARALFDEFSTFFYLYQIMCLWVWFYFSYYKMGLVQMSVIIISAIFKAFMRVTSEKRVKLLAEQQDTCLVRRDGVWSSLSTKELVPGDVISIKSGMQLTCDCAVVSGEVVVDESSLTGEAMPVRKLPLKNDSIPFSKTGSGKTYSLFAGTTVLQCASGSSAETLVLNSPEGSVVSSAVDSNSEKLRGTQTENSSSGTSGIRKRGKGNNRSDQTNQLGRLDDSVDEETLTKAIVLATRANTNKGQMVQRIMFPSEYSFVFNEHLRIVVAILLTWGAIAFCLSIWLMGHDLTSWFYGLFVISQILSPLLPASFVIGQSVAASRLRKLKIFCIDLPRIMVAGKVKIFCFDKTGTLTREGLEFSSVQSIGTFDRNTDEPGFGAIQEDVSKLDEISQVGLATCHAVAMIGDTKIGNPVDVEQFRATDWEILTNDNKHEIENSAYIDSIISPYLETKPGSKKGSRKVVHVVKRFEFEHARQSMSVAVFDPETRHVHVFIKGSFEKLKKSCNPASLPSNYDKETAKWASEGCYLLAMSHKDLGVFEDLSVFANMTREDMESNCSMIMLIMFRNKLKEDTSSALTELRKGNTRCVMITGDNALTGIYIARASSMIDSDAQVYLGDMEMCKELNEMRLVWRDPITREEIHDIDSVLSTEADNISYNEEKLGDIVARRTSSVELAVTAASFDYLISTNQIRKYLLDIRIFSRMTPEGKVAAVRLHMERAVTGMCGDGGNDCGALRAAHVGLALSESEASIVSPFSSSNRSIHSCVNLLIHGRTALATSFAAYKFLIMYGETMAWLELFMFYFSVIVPQAVWIFIDSFIAVGLLFALTQSRPAKKLLPFRPTARLLGFNTILSAAGQVFINFVAVCCVIVMLFNQSWFKCHEFDSRDIDTSLWWLLGDNFEAETLSILILTQFINAAGVFNLGYRYRSSWARNYLLVALYSGFLFVVSYVCLADPNRLGCLFRINCGDPDVLVSLGYPRPSFSIDPYNSPIGHNVFNKSYRWKMWGYTTANALIVFMFEYFVVLGPIGRYFKSRSKRGGTKKQIMKL
ncbi:hypothetical protein BB559_003426 [Furculomyces boomerangus]|uniref:P-type ATPase A domain-containing protein n=1 Tax=Furculomyces boomerangus TaxID=61424 RepID=A0A2T9YLE6_9FUNG|nr:hypothetical protein BB559_003426 [Furculomyces boomerangus]